MLIVGRLTEIHPNFVLVGNGARIVLPAGFSTRGLQEGMHVTIVTTHKDGDVVAEQIWRSPADAFAI